MRWNGGGDTFLAQTLLHHLIGCPAINRRGALFVILCRLTFSAAQNTVTAIDCETNAVFVGKPTGSRPNFIGESSYFELPYSKLQANAADPFWPTSWRWDNRTWVAPDIYAPPTLAAFSRNQDPAMEAVLACREYVPVCELERPAGVRSRERPLAGRLGLPRCRVGLTRSAQRHPR